MTDPIEIHESAIRELGRRREAGEVSEEECLGRSLGHAAAIRSLRGSGDREVWLEMARFALSQPALVEACVVGLHHYLTSMKGEPRDGR